MSGYDVARLLRESLDSKLDPIGIAQRIDGAYIAFEESGKIPIEFPQEQTREILSLLAYGYVADVMSDGAEYSSAASKCSNPRLVRFEQRFRHVAEMTGIDADLDTYLVEAHREHDGKRRTCGKPGEKTIRSGRFGAPSNTS